MSSHDRIRRSSNDESVPRDRRSSLREGPITVPGLPTAAAGLRQPEPVAAAAPGWGGLRTMTTSTMSGAIWPPMMRSVESVFTESLFRMV